MSRENCRQWFSSPPGRILIENEAKFLSQTITLSYTQTILSLAYLGWEKQFIDVSCYRHFFILDQNRWPQQKGSSIQAQAAELPIASDSIDMVILPHLLEFEANRHQILREVERVLKAEGELIVLGFNPWSLFSLQQRCRCAFNFRKQEHNQVDGHFISRFRMIDWLNRLNFEAEVVAGFAIDKVATAEHAWQKNKNNIAVTAYAIHAIKRRFNLIPLQEEWIKVRKFALAGANVSTSAKTTK